MADAMNSGGTAPSKGGPGLGPMDRRTLMSLTLAFLAAPRAVGAESPSNVERDAAPPQEIGVLFPGMWVLLPMHDFQGVHAGGKPPDFSGRLRELATWTDTT